MNKLSYILIIGILIMSAALILPYMEYDIREAPKDWFDFSDRPFIAVDQILQGSSTSLSYIPMAWILIPLLLSLYRISKAKAIVLLVFSAILTILMVGLYFALTAKISFYYGRENVELLGGFWCSFIGCLVVLVGAISIVRERFFRK